MKKFVFAVMLLVGFSSGAMGDYRDDIDVLTKRMQALAGSETGLSDSERFNEIVDITYNYTMLASPEFATYLGDPRGQDRWSDQSEAAILRLKEDEKVLLAALANIDRQALTVTERVNYDLLYDRQKREIEGLQFPGELMPLNQMGGVQQNIAQMMSITRPKNAEDYANMIARLQKTPEVVEQTIALMR